MCPGSKPAEICEPPWAVFPAILGSALTEHFGMHACAGIRQSIPSPGGIWHLDSTVPCSQVHQLTDRMWGRRGLLVGWLQARRMDVGGKTHTCSGYQWVLCSTVIIEKQKIALKIDAWFSLTTNKYSGFAKLLWCHSEWIGRFYCQSYILSLGGYWS